MIEDALPPFNTEQLQAKRQIEALGGSVLRHYGPDGTLVDLVTFKENFTDAELPLFFPFRQPPLYGIGFVKVQVTDEGIATALRRFAMLKALTIVDMPIGDAALAPLKHFQDLEEVGLDRTRITSATLEHLDKQSKLIHLTVSGTNIDDTGLKYLTQLKALRLLFVGNTRLTSVGLRYIGKITSLTSLTVHETQIDDEGLEHLVNLDRLDMLMLDNTQVTNAGMAHIAKLKGLKTLYIENTKVDQQGLQLLQNMPKLEEVRFLDWKTATAEQKRFHARFHLYLPANHERFRVPREQFERGELEIH